ncbi:GspH/FimT family pseudopilin [Halomonas sp. hl-4]|uniref:GspH/FimT family pseudopilin n=1 Tax=Halomonas sp. hl-4 TaxID=1761789 RepID=UPI000BB82F93|nr:GspH/FimT family pseudopilin [Halomonas sp. hl-4]SNY98619.1 type IV fimbrial biogenesis protein FimT [Halomonas sp. hl-4]
MRQRGFTLIELMLVLVIAALLMLIAVPSFSTFMARQQLAGDVNQLQSVMTFARSEAIKQRQPITVKFSPPNELNATRRPEACSDASWCFWAESSQDDGEASVMRAGQTAKITQPKDNFSIVFESLGDAHFSDCDDGNGQCVIALAPTDSGDDSDPVTITVRETGSLHKDTAQ